MGRKHTFVIKVSACGTAFSANDIFRIFLVEIGFASES